MFTGIVEELGRVKSISRGTKSIRLTIGCEKVLEDIKFGDSISVNGICLTVCEFNKNTFSADVMPETLDKTGLGTLANGSKVNLERALRLSDRLGGHLVSGHIDGTGFIVDIKKDDNAIWLTIEANYDILKYIIMKGSVCLNGTSLTVAFVDNKYLKVSLIPVTASETTLGELQIGDIINIECDVIGKYIEKLMQGNKEDNGNSSKINMDFLKENGFA